MKLSLHAAVFCLCFFHSHLIIAAVTLSNLTTELIVNGGEAENGLIPSNGYFRYTDLIATEETTWSIDPLLIVPSSGTTVLSNGAAGGFGSPVDSGNGVVTSTAIASGIMVTAETELIASNAKTTFNFESASPLDGSTFVFYAENDLFSFSNDAAAFTGSIAGDDLVLFMFDSVAGGLSVRMTGEEGQGSELTLFGAGIWTAWGTALEGGDLSVLSSDGSNFEIVGDLGLALGFALSGTEASLVVNYDTQPEPPPPDFDSDGDVDGADFLKWQRDDGSPENLARWHNNYSTADPLEGFTSLPEPTTVALLLVLLTTHSMQRLPRSWPA